MKQLIAIFAALGLVSSVYAADAKKEEPKKEEAKGDKPKVKPVGKDGKPVDDAKKPAEPAKK